jgi:DNA-binding SARP family transcriptional activator
MQFGVLGPLLVQDAKGPVIVSSPKQRALLAILLLESSKTPVRAERLIDELWGRARRRRRQRRSRSTSRS